MKKFRAQNRLLLIAISVAVFITGTAFARGPVTQLSNDPATLGDKPIIAAEPVTVGKGNLIGGFIGKVLNVPKQVKLSEVGYLAFALSNEAIQAIPSEKATKELLPYFLASKEMQDSLKLRRTARQIRYQYFKKVIPKLKELTAEQKKAILDFLSQSVGSPMVMMAKSPLPSFMPTPGPCMIPLGVEVVQNKTGKRLDIETSMICVLDIEAKGKKLFSVKDAMNNDTLDLVLCHENAHAIQFDLYGKLFQKIQRVSTNGHDAPYITDLGLAYIEGWAEAFEAVYGPSNPKLKEKDRKKYNISEFLYGRQDPIRRDRYVWAQTRGRKTGVLKNGLQLMSTEGVIAGLFYDILTSRAINAPFDKCVMTMLANPMNFVEFVKTYVKMFPEDKKVIYRIFLENTHYVTMHAKAAEAYKNYYQHKLAFVQKRESKADFLKARDAYKNYTEALFKKAMANDKIFENIGPQLWFEGKINLTKLKEKASNAKKIYAELFGKKDEYYTFRMDLNTVTVDMLRTIGMAEADASKIIEARETAGFFKGNPISILTKVLGKERFDKYNEVYNLCVYNHEKADEIKQYKEQALTLWPEDIEKMSQN
ncbi:MAG: hypothetical protein Kow0029_27690 [Candidatus Rifleibacteriota bacterium]